MTCTLAKCCLMSRHMQQNVCICTPGHIRFVCTCTCTHSWCIKVTNKLHLERSCAVSVRHLSTITYILSDDVKGVLYFSYSACRKCAGCSFFASWWVIFNRYFSADWLLALHLCFFLEMLCVQT